LEEKVKELREREEAHNAKAAQRLKDLVCDDILFNRWMLMGTRSPAIPLSRSPSPPSASSVKVLSTPEDLF